MSFETATLGTLHAVRTSAGVDLYRIDMIIELIITLLPDPVDPAISRCGMASSAAIRIRPLISFPSGIVIRDDDDTNSSLSSICRSAITSRRVFGTSIPTVGFPGIRSIRTAPPSLVSLRRAR